MKPHRELTMTIICRSCENQFGAWRPRCPTCGTEAPKAAREAMLEPRATRAVKQHTPRERKSTDCIFCYRRNAKDVCSTCNEPIHTTCIALHANACAEYQASLVRAHVDATVNALNNPAAVA